MKFIIVAALALVACAVAAPAEPQFIKIVRSDIDQQPDGSYDLNVETENGIKQIEKGELRTINDEENKPHNVVVVRGTYSYINLEGNVETIEYYADETGFHAQGPSVPKAPARR